LMMMTDVPAQAVKVVLEAYAAQTRLAHERAERERETETPRPLETADPPPPAPRKTRAASPARRRR